MRAVINLFSALNGLSTNSMFFCNSLSRPIHPFSIRFRNVLILSTSIFVANRSSDRLFCASYCRPIKYVFCASVRFFSKLFRALKTFPQFVQILIELIDNCINKKTIKNTGQLPKCLIRDHHEAIIPREQFNAVQFEMARRRAQESRIKKSAPTGLGKFSGKYALSGLVFCAEYGTAYRRVVWTQHGEKRAVWRCMSRLDYGKRYCLHSPTLDEEPLQQAVLAAINAAMSDHEALVAQITDAMEQELAPIPGEGMSLGDIERAIEELGKQFDVLLLEASNAVNTEEYAERFRAISNMIEELKRRKGNILQICQEQEQIERRVHAATAVMNTIPSELTEWDDSIVYQMLEKVSVLSREKIRVTFRGGTEIEQVVDQPKRRKFA